MPDAVLYGRFSPRPSADECDSVEKLIERNRAYAAGHGYTVAAVHSDKELSGGRADNRPGLQKAIAEACGRRAVLVVHSLSRLARNTRDAIDLAERLNKAAADLAVIQENVNTRSPMGRFIFTFFFALAQLEREQIGERTSAAMLRHQATGRRMTRPDPCPYGWRSDSTDPDRLAEDAGSRPSLLESGRSGRTETAWRHRPGPRSGRDRLPRRGLDTFDRAVDPMPFPELNARLPNQRRTPALTPVDTRNVTN
jgi:DNA invertase Pin-like site-specific DNA recombinase